MHELTWLYIFMLALEAEKLGKFDQAERLERLALITAYKAGFVDSLIQKGSFTTLTEQGQISLN